MFRVSHSCIRTCGSIGLKNLRNNQCLRKDSLARNAIQGIKENTISNRPNFGLVAGFSTAAVTTGGILGFMQRNPFVSQVGIATVKTSLADMLVQMKVENRETIDWRRNLLFIMFGGLYLGVFQWGVYVIAFQRIFPGMAKFCNQSIREKLKNKQGIRELFGQILLDFVFIQPVLYFPVFYTFKTFVEPSENANKSRLTIAFDNWKKNFWVDNLGMSGFWLPMDLIIYSVPLWIRLPLNHAISFAWVCVLSFFRGKEDRPVVSKIEE